MPTEARKDTGGAVVSLLLIALGCLVIWDTTTYADSDSAVFPRTFAAVMIVAAVAYVLTWLAGRGEDLGEPAGGSSRRRICLIVVMLAGALAMPWLGFLFAALPVFGALLLVAMYDPWTTRRMILYPVIGLAIVFGFYFLFNDVLLVPLPTPAFL